MIKVYINQISPIRCKINPSTATRVISLKHKVKGDFAVKSIINLANKILFINIILNSKLNP